MHYLRKVYFLLVAVSISFNASGVTDSLGIKEEDGEKFIMHRVDKGQTLFAISQRYDVEVEQLKETNPQTEDDLVVGEVILIPLHAYEKRSGKYHTVQKEETLYSIAQQYDVTVEQIKEWNGLSSNNIEIGQELKVGEGENSDNSSRDKNNKEENQSDSKQIKPEEPKNNTSEEKASNPNEQKSSPNNNQEAEAQSTNEKSEEAKPDNPDEEASVNEPDTSEPKSKLAKKFKQTKNTDKDDRSGNKVSKEQEGKATWLSHIDSEKSLALHRSAPPGTIIKVTNLVNGEVVYVKTVGKLNKNEDEATLITISPKAAEELNVSDDFFRAKLEYSYRKPSN